MSTSPIVRRLLYWNWLKKLKAMTDKEFCEVYSSYYGEKMDHIGQLVQTTLTGEELKDLIEYFISQLTEDDKSNQAY
jgi:hypothetical protein